MSVTGTQIPISRCTAPRLASLNYLSQKATQTGFLKATILCKSLKQKKKKNMILKVLPFLEWFSYPEHKILLAASLQVSLPLFAFLAHYRVPLVFCLYMSLWGCAVNRLATVS